MHKASLKFPAVCHVLELHTVQTRPPWTHWTQSSFSWVGDGIPLPVARTAQQGSATLLVLEWLGMFYFLDGKHKFSLLHRNGLMLCWLKWAFLIKLCPLSVVVVVVVVNFSGFHLLLQNHLANFNHTCIIGWREFKFFFQMKGFTLLRNLQNTLTKFKNLLLHNHWANFNQS